MKKVGKEILRFVKIEIKKKTFTTIRLLRLLLP